MTEQSDAELYLAHPSRTAMHRAVFQVLRDYRVSNMADEDGYPYPLVDLMSNPAPADISTGEMQMISLTDEIVEAISATQVQP